MDFKLLTIIIDVNLLTYKFVNSGNPYLPINYL